MILIPLLSLLLMAGNSAQASSLREWNFTVYLDGEEIGYHTFIRTPVDNRFFIESKAEFNVRFLNIPLFSYLHRSEERWSEDCLESLSAVTETNGREIRVEGALESGTFVTSVDGKRDLYPACTASFAYWERDLLGQPRLLNPQTGELVEVNLQFLGRDSIKVHGTITPADHYRLTSDEREIDLWYSDASDWLALQSTVSGNRQLRYEAR